MKKRALSLVMACMMAGSLLAGCGSKTAEETKAANTETKAEGEEESAEAEGTEAAEGGDFKVVCLVNGSLGDKGFFDSAAEGLNKYADFSIIRRSWRCFRRRPFLGNYSRCRISSDCKCSVCILSSCFKSRCRSLRYGC